MDGGRLACRGTVAFQGILRAAVVAKALVDGRSGPSQQRGRHRARHQAPAFAPETSELRLIFSRTGPNSRVTTLPTRGVPLTCSSLWA